MPSSSNLTYSNIVAYTYKLNTEDKLIVHRETYSTYIIIEGIVVISKIFTNKEKFSICIIDQYQIINTPFNKENQVNYFYQIQALTTTYLLSFPNKEIQKIKNIIPNENKQILSYYHMIEILIHKNIRQRLIHLLINLSEFFGQYKKTYILINISLSYNTIGSIIGANKNTISKLIKELEHFKIITYKKQHIIIHDLITLSYYQQRNSN
uniref:Global nitrogen transcriptional regulator n=1 Tax=Dichotomaria marginata TaxID=268567 RepID=A0A1G4NSH8_9FLOR|nr:Global nitrogen transcriptional regulator [Dichotomaria marginata]SCW21642.1 Global nitrogen transcriptional regulator [Dichotomaria marginata]